MEVRPGADLSSVGQLAMLAVAVAVVLGFVAITLSGALARQGDVLTGRDGALYPAWVRTVGERPAQAAAASQRIVAARDKLARQGVALVVVLVPTKARAAGSAAPGPLRRRAGRAAYADWVTGLRSRGVEVVDAGPAIGAHGFLARDTHCTAQAAERVADAAAGPVARRLQLGAAGDGQPPGPWVQVARRGDLAELLARRTQTGGPRELVLERDYVAPVGARTAVWVVGSSFAAGDHGFPQRLGQRVDRGTRVLVRLGEDGTWAAMDALQPEPGQVVAWIVTEGALTDGSAGSRSSR